MNNYIPEFILKNQITFDNIKNSIEKKQYDELTINIKNLVDLSLKPEDLLDIYYYAISTYGVSNVSKKILEIELKKSKFYNEVPNIINNLNIEHKNYLLDIFHTKLKKDNKSNKRKLFFVIPLTLLMILFTLSDISYYFIFYTIACISWVVALIRVIYLNNKLIKERKL